MPMLDAAFALKATGGKLLGSAVPGPFTGVSTDTRSIKPGELFVALKGPNFDAHDFVDKALEARAACAMVHKKLPLEGGRKHSLLLVEDTLHALGELARAWRAAHQIRVAAVTGSNGKTTTKEMLASILAEKWRVHKNRGNLNNLIGLPLSIFGLKPEHEISVLEMGMNQPGEIKRLCEIAAPSLGLITNIGMAHIGPMGSLENIAKAKGELFDSLSEEDIAVINLDDRMIAPRVKELNCRVVTFGMNDDPQVKGSDVSALGTRQAFSLRLPREEPQRVRLSAAGPHNSLNALAASAAAWALGLSGPEIKAGLEKFSQVSGRLMLKKSLWGYSVIDDTYNCNPASLSAGLEAQAAIAGIRRRVLILGDMAELGEAAARLHEQAGENAVRSGCKLVLAMGEFADDVCRGALKAGLKTEACQGFCDLFELIEAAQGLLKEGDMVLIKGSRATRMERVVGALTDGEVG